MNIGAANGRDDHPAGLTVDEIVQRVGTGRELHHLQLVLRDELARGRVVQDGDRYRANLATFDAAVLVALRGLELDDDESAAARRHDRNGPRWSAGREAVERSFGD